MADEEEETQVGCNASPHGIDLVRTGGGMPMRVFQMSWEDVEGLIIARGQNIAGAEVGELADQLKGPEKKP